MGALHESSSPIIPAKSSTSKSADEVNAQVLERHLQVHKDILARMKALGQNGPQVVKLQKKIALQRLQLQVLTNKPLTFDDYRPESRQSELGHRFEEDRISSETNVKLDPNRERKQDKDLPENALEMEILFNEKYKVNTWFATSSSLLHGNETSNNQSVHDKCIYEQERVPLRAWLKKKTRGLGDNNLIRRIFRPRRASSFHI